MGESLGHCSTHVLAYTEARAYLHPTTPRPAQDPEVLPVPPTLLEQPGVVP